MRILVELQAQNPPAAGAGLGATKWPRRRPWGARCAAGARRACNARPADRKQGMYCGYARGGVAFGRVLGAPTVAGARVHDRRDAGRLRRPYRGASKHGPCAPCAAAGAREARRRGYVVRTDRPRRAARARGAEGAVLPAGGRYFYKGPPGSTREDEIEISKRAA